MLSSAFCATASTSSSEPPWSACAPATLKANTMPATPRRRSASSGGAEATSSLHQHRPHLDVFHVGHLGGHVEVHACRRRSCRRCRPRPCPPWMRLRDLAASGRRWARRTRRPRRSRRACPCPRSPGTPAGGRSRRPWPGRPCPAPARRRARCSARSSAGIAQLVGVGLQQPVQHLDDELVGVVQDLLHACPPVEG